MLKMPGQTPLTKEGFLYLAEEAGLDTTSPHMEELYRYVQNALAGARSLNDLEVNGVEPDMAFIPERGGQ
jgi:hypothetical protein